MKSVSESLALSDYCKEIVTINEEKSEGFIWAGAWTAEGERCNKFCKPAGERFIILCSIKLKMGKNNGRYFFLWRYLK